MRVVRWVVVVDVKMVDITIEMDRPIDSPGSDRSEVGYGKVKDLNG